MRISLCAMLLIGIAWAFGFAYGKTYWGRQYDEINADLRSDITKCRTTLNQCLLDLDNPHHCVSVCEKEFEKYGC